jgi:hypothetical protein
MQRILSGHPATIVTGAIVALLLMAGSGPAQAEPPIRSPEDAACRAEAKAKVFSAPNPEGLEIEEVGRGLYYACMDRITRKPKAPPGRRHRLHSR